jgi:hypothetical protein
MTEELSELQEHAEHAREHPDLAPVSLTMAVLAVLVATVSLLGHRTHTEEVILQNKVTDQWSYYQAKNIRRHNDELFADLTSVIAAKDSEAAAKLHEKYHAEAERYKDDQKELDAKAREFEKEGEETRRKADRFDLAEVFLEIALVVSSITLLSGRRVFWHLGLFMAAGGILVAASVWVLH